MLNVRNRRRRNLHKETLRELLQLRADKRFLLAAQGASLAPTSKAGKDQKSGGKKLSSDFDDDEEV